MNIEQLPVTNISDNHYEKDHMPFDIGELVRKQFYPEDGIFIVVRLQWLYEWGSWEAHVYSQLLGEMDSYASSVFVGLENLND